MSVEFIVFEAYQLTLITMSKYQPALINVTIQCSVGDNKANDWGQIKTLYVLNALFLDFSQNEEKKNYLICLVFRSLSGLTFEAEFLSLQKSCA